MPEVKAVDTNPRGAEPRKLGRAEVAGAHVETIQESKYENGSPRHGINLANIHRGGSAGYNDPSSEAHRASERSAPPQKR